MSDAPFSSAARRALDRFEPPPLAPGFADRVLGRVRARDDADLPPLPKRTSRWAASPWRRGGVLFGALAGASLVSAAAAATGVFGEPVEVPVISPIARSLDIVPARVTPRPPARVAAPAAGGEVARERIDALIDDPSFRALPPLERRAELRRTAREMINAGEAQPREVIDALRETGRERVAELTPEERKQLVEAVAERRQERREWIAGTTPAERRQIRRQFARERQTEAQAAVSALPAGNGESSSVEHSVGEGEGLAADGR